MIASLSSGRATAATVDCLQLPYQRTARAPVVFCHGHGSDASQAMGAVSPATLPILRGITDSGGFPVGSNSQGNKWGTSAARSKVTDAVALLRTSAGGAHATKKVLLVGVSMGGTTVLAWANANPTLVAGIVLFLPALDLQAIRVADTLSLRASIDAAYDVTYPSSLPAGSSPADFAAALSAIPIDLWYASDDDVSVNHATFASTHGNTTEHSVGATGHGNTSIAAIDIPTVVAFVRAKAA